MRNFEERRAEVLRRGADGVRRRKQAFRAVTGTVSVLVLCFCIFTAYNFGNANTKGKIDGFGDNMVGAEKNEVPSPTVSDELPSEQSPIVPPSNDMPEHEDPVTNVPEQVFPETEKPEWEPPEDDKPQTDEQEDHKPDQPSYLCYVMAPDGGMISEIYGKENIENILRYFDGFTGKDDSALENKPANPGKYYSVSIVYDGECIAYRLYDGYLQSLTDWSYYLAEGELYTELCALLGIN